MKLKKQIETLFLKGKAFQFDYLRFIWVLHPNPTDGSKIKFGVSVPKKKIKKAHLRNTTKRRIKEAWRLQQQELKAKLPPDTALHIFIIYQHYEVKEYASIAPLIKAGLSKLTTIVLNQIPLSDTPL